MFDAGSSMFNRDASASESFTAKAAKECKEEGIVDRGLQIEEAASFLPFNLSGR
jgi:hypothetical protein